MAIELFAHNKKAYLSAVALMASAGKAAVIHPTGTGKSYIAFALCEANPQAATVWISPSEYIYKTQRQALRRTNPELTLDNVRFMTYAKLMLLSQRELLELRPQYIILDEFHRAGAECWGEGVNRLLRLYPGARLLGLSATSVRYLDNQKDMAQLLFDGCIASEMTLGECIVRGILPAPKYVTTVFHYQQELEKYQGRVDALKSRGLRDTNQEYLDALRRAIEKADGLDKVFARHISSRDGKYIVFCASYEHMQEMVSHVQEWFGAIDAAPHVYQVYSDDPETDAVFEAFKADASAHLKLLFCIDMLNEGVHVKGISGVILFRPTISPIIYKQQIGRALTTGDNCTPLILDVVNNFENLVSIAAIQEEMHTAIWRMRAEGEADAIVTERFEVTEQVEDCRLLFEKLQNSLSSTWEQYFAAASTYAAEHGNLEVPKHWQTPAGLSLGSWITTQRRIRAGQAAGQLTPQQIERLDSIGMVWENRLEIAWERNFAAAQAYYSEYGNLLVPAKYVTEDGTRLGAWIASLRQRYANNQERNLLTAERIERLEKIGMVWDAVSEQWERNYAEALHYYTLHGNLQPKYNYRTETGFALGAWLRNLRQLQSSRTNGRPLTQQQVERLNAIGMTWGNRNDERWQRAYNAARQYYAVHGNLDIPLGYIAPDGIALGRWVARQRSARRNPGTENARLTPQRIAMLDAIGMRWERAGMYAKPRARHQGCRAV